MELKSPDVRADQFDFSTACRKRRIKCDEAKPICSNCIKSKRQCEGYNQRVVFKSPMGALPGGPFGPIPYHHLPDPTEALVNAQFSATQGKASSSSQGPLPIIAPKPPSQYNYGSAAPYPFGMYPSIHRVHSAASLGLGIQQPQYIMDAVSPESFYTQPSLEMAISPTQMSQPDFFDFQVPPPQQTDMGFTLPERRHTAFARIERPVVSPTVPFTPPIPHLHSARFEPEEKADSWPIGQESVCYESEEEEVPMGEIAGLDAQNLGPIVANTLCAPLDLYGTQVRSFHALADERVLANYVPSPTDTPLNDPKTAAVFWYFVTVTAPSLNPYERNRIDPSRIFSGEPIPKSDQHIWSCKFANSARSCHNVANSPQMSFLYSPSSTRLFSKPFSPLEACRWPVFREIPRLLRGCTTVFVFGGTRRTMEAREDGPHLRRWLRLYCLLSMKFGFQITRNGAPTCLGQAISLGRPRTGS